MHKDAQTDKHEFIGPFRLMPGVQKYLIAYFDRMTPSEDACAFERTIMLQKCSFFQFCF